MKMNAFLAFGLAFGILVTIALNGANVSPADDEKIVAQLDAQYPAAVEKNDAPVMDRILADDLGLVTGAGKTLTKADLLEEARSRRIVYEHQDDTDQTVRIWGNTAVVTAKLRAKGAENGKSFEYPLWFSDTYVRTSAGWRYAFGQAALPLPKAPWAIPNTARIADARSPPPLLTPTSFRPPAHP